MSAGRRRARGRATSLAAALLLAGCTAAAGGATAAAPAPAGAPREAVVRVGPFADVWAVAVAPTRVFVVAAGGVAVYDRGRGAWSTPLAVDWQLERPMGLGQRPLAATNLIGDALWIVLGSRAWVVRPAIGAVWSTDLGDVARQLVVDRGGADAYAVGARWTAIGATGGARPLEAREIPPAQRLLAPSQRVDPARLEDPLLRRDAALRAWPLAAYAAAETPGDVWLGTAGGGVFHADLDFHRSTQLPYGPHSSSLRALARLADGVLVADDPGWGGGAEPTLTIASDDLARWSWPVLDAPLGAVSALAVRGNVACAGGAGGAVLAPLPRGDASPRLAVEPAVSEPVTAIVGGRDGCYVGTERGLWLVPWPGAAGLEAPHLAGQPLGRVGRVRDVVTSADTAWILGERGLSRAVAAVGPVEIRLATAVPLGPAVLALTADGLALAAGDELWIGRGAARTERFERSTVSLGRVGRVAAMAADGDVLWIGGGAGALAVDLATGRVADVPTNDPRETTLPAFGSRDVRAIVLAPGVAWLATAAGLVRVRRGADGLPR